MIFVKAKGLAFVRRDGEGFEAPERSIGKEPVCLLQFPLEAARKRHSMVIVDPATIPEPVKKRLIKEAEDALEAQLEKAQLHKEKIAARSKAPPKKEDAGEKKQGRSSPGSRPGTGTESEKKTKTTSGKTQAGDSKKAKGKANGKAADVKPEASDDETPEKSDEAPQTDGEESKTGDGETAED